MQKLEIEMKRENQFVAQLFHCLAPFVDVEKELFICVDGGAAHHHANKNGATLKDAVLPDLWLTFVGDEDPTGIEAKIIRGNSTSFRNTQIAKWCSTGKGHYKPAFWVSANVELKEFRCWQHSTMEKRLDAATNKRANNELSLTGYPPDFETRHISELARYILAHAGNFRKAAKPK